MVRFSGLLVLLAMAALALVCCARCIWRFVEWIGDCIKNGPIWSIWCVWGLDFDWVVE